MRCLDVSAQWVLYGRSYCHLCGEMIAALAPWHARYQFDLQVVDVDADPALEARFGARVPVLVVGGRELCHYRLDEAALQRYFDTD